MANSVFCKAVAVAAAFGLVLFVYWPGLSGAFMLDDLSSLPTLYGNIEQCGWWCGVLTGSTGPTGRPLSLMTFAFQASQWSDPYYFKVVNLGIHIVNSALLFLIFSIVVKRLGIKRGAFMLPLLASLIWSVLPIQVSSVLYVIQRMALLSSMFVLVGVLYYLVFRKHLVSGTTTPWRFFGFSVGLACIGVLSLISKESGILMLVYILTLELLLYRERAPSVDIKLFRWGILYIPLGVVALYLATPIIFNPEATYSIREFTLLERLLTQGRILTEYLYNAFLPRASSLGLYHDDFEISTGIVQPITTLLSWLFLATLATGAIWFRRRMALFSLAIFWFLGGHLLESTIIPLELYFEHRNYVPLAMLVLALTVACHSLLHRYTGSNIIRPALLLASGGYVVLLAVTTYNQSVLWGDEFKYSLVQATEHPESIRARALEVDVYSQAGLLDKSYELAQKMAEDFPGNAGLAVLSMDYHCVDTKFPLVPEKEVADQLRRAKFGYGAIKTFSDYLNGFEEGRCQQVSPAYVLPLVRALRNNPVFATKDAMLLGYEARLLGLLGKYEAAVTALESSSIREDDWVIYIRYLAISGQIEKGIEQADYALDLLEYKPYFEVYKKEIERLKNVLLDDLKQEN